MKIEVVYFVQQGDAGPIKIGRTRNFVNRLDHMASGNSCELNVRALVPGSLELEALLHDRFAQHRIRGEWFYPHASLLEYIATLPDVLLRDLRYRRKKRRGLTLEQAKEVWADPNISSPQARAMIGWGNPKIGRLLGWTRPVGRQLQGMKSAAISAARKGVPQVIFTDAQKKDAKSIWRNTKEFPKWEDVQKEYDATIPGFTVHRAFKTWKGRT